METTSITFITGGVRSGKSSFAERIAIQKAEEIGGTLHYIATGKATDSEMRLRIKRHQEDRNKWAHSWKTWEKETNISSLAPEFNNKDIILLDCLTTMLSNELFAHEADWEEQIKDKEKVFWRIWHGIKEIADHSNQVVLVSNEVLNEPILPNPLLRTYSELLGKLHQKIVHYAEKAYLVESGVPLMMKGGD
ncbi:bifunctional adenosylcobinamide kinase/adenosylcobinamide-phosphate guanylyltransferase [Oceanobacillus sp. Castelsardo]|uniref:bifunctional adenosylcobinamide kinase/adenosylcobinamide-phosphate guanylyltransferase n=1 Tax=Oceanobacillus sp. Castelsardo TaxID=1851204 RepID=UPI000837E60A|nr:bifunctional adenosylcobinamide kinase/adenosylcobinamide-phosphate guanylyltransferase [Oceanobacillus sp. Castelsardo]